jgi:hypothetical protein
MHNDFTLYSRKVPSEKRVFYYYAYNYEGERLGPWATGKTTKTATRNYCNRLIKLNRLLPGAKEIPTFAEYVAYFCVWKNSPYFPLQII